LGKKCGRCSTRYCGPECQKQHWEGGGHDKLCKKIKRSGGAEQFNANIKYTEAVAVTVEKCADDTKGQTCYICTQALHWKTKEGLVRMCACRGTAGFAHVSCLAEQAKILLAEAEENNLGEKVLNARWLRWGTCGLCEQDYHGVVACALGWACWKTYVGRPEEDVTRCSATNALGNGLHHAGHHEDGLAVEEAELAMKLRLGDAEEDILQVQTNLACTYSSLGREEDALRLKRDVYSGYLKLHGEEHEHTLQAANNYASSLGRLQRFEEAKALLRRMMPVARRVYGESHQFTLKMRKNYAGALCKNDAATLDDLREAVTTLEDIERTARRVLGGAHPTTSNVEQTLRDARAALVARESDDVSSVCEAVDAANLRTA
jgi:hypothetical protein